MNRRAMLASVGGITAGLLAGCNGGDQPETTEEQIPEESPMDTPTASDVTVTVKELEPYGDILADSEGMTLYLFTDDSPDSSACSGSCAENWPPLTVEDEPMAGEGVTASLSTIERDDGSMQVVAGEWPLYYFANDSNPDDATGQGLGGKWYVLGPDGSAIETTPTG